MPKIIWADEDGKIYEAFYSYSLHRVSVFRIISNSKSILVFRKTEMSNSAINKFVEQLKRFEVKNAVQ